MSRKKTGKVLCYKCEGSGKIKLSLRVDGYDPEQSMRRTVFYMRCKRCNGSGKIEWIDNIVRRNI